MENFGLSTSDRQKLHNKGLNLRPILLSPKQQIETNIFRLI